MEIIFNKEEAIRHHALKYREEMLRCLGEFCDAESIEYKDHGKSETYTIKKNRKELVLQIGGNMYDGGFLNVKGIINKEYKED